MSLALTRAAACVAAATALSGVAACGDDDGKKTGGGGNATTTPAKPTPSGWVTLRHEPTKFAIQAPRGYALREQKGIYVLRKGPSTLTFSRALTTVSPTSYGDALLRQVGGSVSSRHAAGDEFTAQVSGTKGREAFVIRGGGQSLSVTTGRGASLAKVRRVGESARGGLALRAGAVTAATFPLRRYQTPDGGATALVPSDAGWTIGGSKGALEGSSAQGRFLLGQSFNVLLPESDASGGTSGGLVGPYVGDPGQAVAQLFPRLDPSSSGFHVTQTIKSGVLPSFSESGLYRLDFQVAGKPWTGVATIATDSPEKYSNFQWSLYYSGISVPKGADGSVGAGLLKVWHSWDPSGGIAQRSQQSRELYQQTQDALQGASEFRAATADRQSRDVGCLLQGYSDIEDNSRAYDLPPLPCDQQYAPGG